jgi:ribose/xylose/arabinose/galactoside ABC-type transport system permease subunit
MTTATDTEHAAESGPGRVRRLARENGVLVVFAIFLVFATIVSGGRFIQPGNLTVIIYQGSVIGVLALGEALVMLVAGIDLSIVAVAILAALVMGAGGSERQQEMNLSGIVPYLGLLPALLLALVGATVVGLINGVAVVKLRIPAFIATLAMALALSGVAMLSTGGTPVNYPNTFYPRFGLTRFLDVPAPVYVVVALAAALGLFLARSKFGVMLYAVGGNPRAARLSGIPVGRVTIVAYTLASFLGALAGFLFLARTGSVSPGSGGSLLLNTIAACVVGGISLYGGKGSIRNAVVGTLLLAGLGNLMNILHVPPPIQDAVSGLIILVAIMINVRLDKDQAR